MFSNLVIYPKLELKSRQEAGEYLESREVEERRGEKNTKSGYQNNPFRLFFLQVKSNQIKPLFFFLQSESLSSIFSAGENLAWDPKKHRFAELMKKRGAGGGGA